jgi:hypothetical protein
MLGVVLPPVAGAAIAAVVDVIPLEIIVHVDVDVVATPSTSVAPSAPGCANRQSYSESDRSRGHNSACGVIRRRVINRRVRVHGSSIHDDGIIRWHIDHVGLRRLHNDHLFVLYNLVFDFHLLARFQSALVLGFLSHSLHRIHNVALLGKKGVAKARRPLNIVREPFHNIRQSCHGLNTGIPRLLRYGIGERLVLKVGIPCHPLMKLDDFQRICGCNQHLAQKRVRVKGNGSHQRIQLLGRNLHICSLGMLGWRCLALGRRRYLAEDRRRCLLLRSKGQGLSRYEEHREQHSEITPISLE